MDTSDFNVSEGAFWHTNLDLYYGYQSGEVVEVEYDYNKYWLATIQYSFRHLVLLKWIGNYGEFWVDTSLQNSFTGSSILSNNTDSSNFPKRLYPPGYHLQSQLKSQFSLIKPINFLVKPSLYNPDNDPYANIRTVDDLLNLEAENNINDTFEAQSPNNNSEAASLVLAKCKTKIAYRQEDVDELEAALHNLNEINSDRIDPRNESPEDYNNILIKDSKTEDEPKNNKLELGEKNNDEVMCSIASISKKVIDEQLDRVLKEEQEEKKVEGHINATVDNSIDETVSAQTFEQEQKLDNCDAHLEICKSLQESAITKGRYRGLDEHSQKVYYLKPKQFFDVGGANQERVLVPGTLLEICHTIDSDAGLELYHWFAIILKNVGGRLKLRWFLCDEPKFKQGRLEIKSCRSRFVKDDEDEEEEDEETLDKNKDEDKNDSSNQPKIPVKNITFSMHFCNPCIHSISHAKSNDRKYRMPNKIISFIEEAEGLEKVDLIEQNQCDFIFDYRRINLDKDRPLIDHILSTARRMRPEYIDLLYAPKDELNRREVLLSTPRTTKLFRGYVKRELESGVFEIHSEPLNDSGELVKFIYPYDSSYTVLPTSWASNNQDCLSIHPSRNPTPLPPTSNDQVTSSIADKDFKQNNPVTTSYSPNFKTSSDDNEINQNSELEQKESASDTQPNTKIEETVQEVKHSTTEEISSSLTLLCEIVRTNNLIAGEQEASQIVENNEVDEAEPNYWSRLRRSRELEASIFECNLDRSSTDSVLSKFKVLDQLEVVHPLSDVIICMGRIRKVVFPLLWIQISADSYTLLPYNSTDIYPTRWSESNNHQLISLLPPLKRNNQSLGQLERKRKKLKTSEDCDIQAEQEINEQRAFYEREYFDLSALNDKQLDTDYILNEKSMYIRIYFNHKCFTGPSLSKGKICSLPQYVGPGPLRLVIEEVMTKVISVAYVPPRILNDLSSKSFEDLLIARNLTNTAPMEFKAKYQKRTHREDIPVCLNPDDIALYCECVCEHLKCCYNLFGPHLYDGDDCPGHCRALTKSNKFMKRATYYREKARLGEFINTNSDSGNSKKSNNNASNKTSRAKYAGRDSSESTSSSVSRSEQVNSRASSAGEDEVPINELKENLVAVEEIEVEEKKILNCDMNIERETINTEVNATLQEEPSREHVEPETDKILHTKERDQNINNNIVVRKPPIKWPNDAEFNMLNCNELKPLEWTVEDVAKHLEWCRLSSFKPYMISEGVDGQALLLLDRAVIKEHFQHLPRIEYSPEEVGKLCRFVEFIKNHTVDITDF